MKEKIKRLMRIPGVDKEEQNRLYQNTVNIALPAAAEGALMAVISAVDTMMVGALGPAAIAAVGLTAQPRMIMLVMAQALCVGTTAIVARRKGEGDDEGARRCLSQSMALMTLIGLAITVLGIVFARPLMALSGANDETLDMSATYYAIVAASFLPNCWQLCICAAFRAIGKTKLTFTTHLLSNLTNVCLNYLLIGGKLGFPRLGVAGAALATSIGTFVAGMAALAFALRPSCYFRYKPFKRTRFDKGTMRGLFTIGLASMSESVFLRAGFWMLQKIVADLGTNAFASYQIVSQVTSLSFTVGDGIAAAGVAMVGQSLGAGKPQEAGAYVCASRKVGYVASGALMTLLIVSSGTLPHLFTDHPAVIDAARLSFMVVVLGIIPHNGRVIYAGCLRGAGDVKYVAVCSFIGVAVLRPLLAWIFCYPLHNALPALRLVETGPWWAYVCDAYVRDALLTVRIRRGAWKQIRL